MREKEKTNTFIVRVRYCLKLPLFLKPAINSILVQRCSYRMTAFNSTFPFPLLSSYNLILLLLFYGFDLHTTLDCFQFAMYLSNYYVIYNKLHLKVPAPTLYVSIRPFVHLDRNSMHCWRFSFVCSANSKCLLLCC